MSQFSKCVSIVNGMEQDDQDALLARLDQYQAMGIAPERAQKMAANDLVAEIKAERAELIRLVEEQHPEPQEKAEPVAEVKPEPVVEPVAKKPKEPTARAVMRQRVAKQKAARPAPKVESDATPAEPEASPEPADAPLLSERDFKEDIPNERWLKEQIDYAKGRGMDRFGSPYIGKVTGLFRDPVVVPMEILSQIKGARDEQNNVRPRDLAAIKKIMRDTGKLPLTDSGKEYPPFITVAHDGTARVLEGNHRIMAAQELGWKEMAVEVRYYDGGQRAPGVMSPVQLSERDPVKTPALQRGTNEPMNNTQVGRAFDRITKAMSRNDLGEILYNWNESELNEDGDKIIGHPGRDGMYSKGALGGKSTIKKSDFINWLLSDAPFDEKVYPGIKADQDWAEKISAARGAIARNEPTAPESGGAFKPSDYRPGVVAWAQERFGDQVAENGRPAWRNFVEWFGDSQVVDDQGKPLVVHHGSDADFSSFDMEKSGDGAHFFTADLSHASSFGNARAFYIKMENPMEASQDDLDAEWDKEHPEGDQDERSLLPRDFVGALVKRAKDAGHDGLIIREMGDRDIQADMYLPFKPAQIKSATDNNGDFDGGDADIRHSKRDDGVWDAPEPSRFDDFVYKMQNKMVDAKRVIESITKAAGQVADDLNVYLQEELFHGRAAKRVADFGQEELQPLMEQIARDGYTIGDVEEYLHARHAQEANAVIAGREASMPDGGSGMKNAQADAYFASLAPADAQKLNDIAAKVDAIIGQTRQLYVNYGLESQATVDGWNQMFKHYVPLQREDKDGRMGIGQGFSVKGKETKGRTGSKRKVVDILANIAMQRERLIVRGEKNRVSQALVGLAAANPNPEFWTVGAPPSERVYDAKTNAVVERTDPMYKSRDNVLVAKVAQPDGSVKEVAVNFNEDDPRALRMAVALKNLDAGSLEGLLGVSAKITRYFSAINTQYNPVFGVVNLVRDVQGAMLNLDATPLAGKKGKIARDTISALAGIYRDLRAARQGRQPASAWAALWDEFQQQGGQTGYRQMFATSQDRADGLQGILTPHGWMDNKWGKFFTANGTLKVPLAKAQHGAAVIFSWLSDYNESMENAVRLSAYKAGLGQGMSKQQAASLAKNLTVNFNRKGQVGQQAGAIYAFFNAAMQGSARIGSTLFAMEGGKLNTLRLSGTGKKVVYGGMLLGAMQALALAAAGFDDEDPPDFVRERSLIIPTGGKTYISIPMPLGFNVIPGLGRHLTEFALSGFKSPAKRAIDIVGMFANGFNPIGNAGISIQTIAPTAIDPLVALSENRDFTGKPIARTSSNQALPGHSQYKDTASTVGKLLSEAINGITGGNAYVAGALSPTPDQIDYLIGQVTGGVGREAGKIEQSLLGVYRGEEVPLHKIPLAGRFFGNSASQASQGSTFYNNVNQLNELETEVKGMRKDGKAQEAAALLRSRPDAYLIAQANVAERQLQRLRREKRELIDKGASRELVKAKEEQATRVMTRLNQAVERLKETAH